MTTPRPIGTAAKVVLESVESALDANSTVYFEVVLALAAEDRRRAVELLGQVAHRNSVALRALTLLRADRLADAQNVIIDSRLKGKGRNES